MRKLAISLVAGAALAGGVVSSASASHDSGPAPGNVVDVVIERSGSEGFDHRAGDWDLLREALIATNLAETVATTANITVFAPPDYAFFLLARDLGYEGRYDEQAVFEFLVGAAGAENIAAVLRYHVVPGKKSVRQLRRSGPLPTLLGPDVRVTFFGRVVDQDRDDRNAWIGLRRNIFAGDQVLHAVTRFLRPLDLEAALGA